MNDKKMIVVMLLMGVLVLTLAVGFIGVRSLKGAVIEKFATGFKAGCEASSVERDSAKRAAICEDMARDAVTARLKQLGQK